MTHYGAFGFALVSTLIYLGLGWLLLALATVVWFLLYEYCWGDEKP